MLQLSEWGPFSDCSVACGSGKRMRRRMMKRGPCPDDAIYSQIEPCEGTQCAGNLFYFTLNLISGCGMVLKYYI